MSSSLYAAAQAASGRRSDGCALAAAGDAADNGADRRAGSHLSGSTLTARAAFTPILIGLEVVSFSTH